MIYCSKCGHELSDESLFCNKCGTKVGTDNLTSIESSQFKEPNKIVLEPSKKSKTKTFFILSIVVLLICLGVGGWYYYNNYTKEQAAIKIQDEKKDYENDLKGIVSLMFEQSADAESIVNTYSKVWSAAIESKYGLVISLDSKDEIKFTEARAHDNASNINGYAMDFNQALKLANQMLQPKILLITESKFLVDGKMKLLNNPTEEYKTAYEIAFNLYGYYNQYISLAESPTGSLTSFNNDAEDLSAQIIKMQKDFHIRLPSN